MEKTTTVPRTSAATSLARIADHGQEQAQAQEQPALELEQAQAQHEQAQQQQQQTGGGGGKLSSGLLAVLVMVIIGVVLAVALLFYNVRKQKQGAGAGAGAGARNVQQQNQAPYINPTYSNAPAMASTTGTTIKADAMAQTTSVYATAALHFLAQDSDGYVVDDYNPYSDGNTRHSNRGDTGGGGGSGSVSVVYAIPMDNVNPSVGADDVNV